VNCPKGLLVEPIGLLRAVDHTPNFFAFAEF